MIPDPWEFTLLALAAFRIWKLIGDDVILDRPRDWLLNKMRNPDGRPFRRGGGARSVYWGAFLECPWCAGAWVVFFLLWFPWIWLPYETIAFAVPWALSAVVGLLGTVWATLADQQDD